MEYKDPTVAQKREIRKEIEKIDIKEFMSGKRVVPTDLAEKLMLYCYEVNENDFYDRSKIGEADITRLCGEAFVNLFIKAEEQKKS